MGPPATDAGRDVANEDFLFHLYRGSELLQDNRVLEAKSELEHALTLQPRDPKGQDLLAVVYFRIGLYPHAIQIYEELLRENPRDHSLRLNLALCYLKTGQAQMAREQLESVVQNNPLHKRAWGYLGLAFERLGDLEKAVHAFERGSHTQMAKRLLERGARVPAATDGTSSPENVAVRAAAKAAFEELDAGELSFSLAAQEQPSSTDAGNQWTATEPGATAAPRGSVSPPDTRASGPPPVFTGSSLPPARKKLDTLDFGVDGGDGPVKTQRGLGSPRPIGDVTRDARFLLPDEGVTLQGSGLALVRTRETASGRGFAARLESIRAYSGDLTTDVMQRQTRGQVANETFGGVGTPIVNVTGSGHLVLGPRHSHRLVSFLLRDEVAFIREENVLGFDLSLSYETGRLAVGEGETAVMVQLRGVGAVLIELLDALATLDVTSARAITVRREGLVGWVGRLVPRALSIGEAPCGQRGLVGFSGEGSILLAAR
jgi:uncharacterized protein (AIM24 family)